MTDALHRIAAALERLSPPPPPAPDLLAHAAYRWAGGALSPVRRFDPLPLAALVGIDHQRDVLLAELTRLARGHAAHDVLLWGARGTGKSALAKAAVAAVQHRAGASALALVEAAAPGDLDRLLPLLGDMPRGFVVFLDDLTFADPAQARVLRSLLEGGAEARSPNVRLVATANRRHLLPRDAQEEAAALHPRDAADDQLALADRFGVSLGFHAIDQEGYLAIVAAHAARHDLPVDTEDALRWAAARGSRSGRIARHYVVDLAGRTGRPL